MHIAVASIRKNARRLQESGRPVTIPALAGLLKKHAHTVRKYVYGIHGLKDEINCLDARATQYRDMAEEMERRGLHVTFKRIAKLCNTTPHVVRTWSQRHPIGLDGIAMVNQHRHFFLHTMQRVRWVCRIQKRTFQGSFSVTRLAYYSGCDRTYLHRLLKKYPELRTELAAIVEL